MNWAILPDPPEVEATAKICGVKSPLRTLKLKYVILTLNVVKGRISALVVATAMLDCFENTLFTVRTEPVEG